MDEIQPPQTPVRLEKLERDLDRLYFLVLGQTLAFGIVVIILCNTLV